MSEKPTMCFCDDLKEHEGKDDVKCYLCLENENEALKAEVERLCGLADELEGLVFDGGRNYDPEEAYRIVQAMLDRRTER